MIVSYSYRNDYRDDRCDNRALVHIRRRFSLKWTLGLLIHLANRSKKCAAVKLVDSCQRYKPLKF